MAENKYWSQKGAMRWELELAAVAQLLLHFELNDLGHLSRESAFHAI